jgi:thiol-disulfide isomerase/thioredoxin
MANIIDVLRKMIAPYYYVILTIVLIVLFVIVAYYAYNQFGNVKQSKFANVANSNRRNKEVSILFFHVDWCPHCKKALPEWNSFKSQNDGKEFNGYIVKCVDMDCTNETSDITRAINEYKIDSYPTIKMLKDGQVIEFDSKITNSSLNAFINSMLNE